MYIFNTTYLVANDILPKWKLWLRDIHIVEMKNLDIKFLYVAEVQNIESDIEQNGHSISVQFELNSIDDVDNLQRIELPIMREKLQKQFGNGVLMFDTILSKLNIEQ